MTMLLEDANDMIARNRKFVAAMQRIRDRMAGEPIDISAHESIVDGQQDESKFGAFLYFHGARDAEFWETIATCGQMYR